MTAVAPDLVPTHRLWRRLVAASVVAGIVMTALLALEARWLPALLMVIAAGAAALAPILRLPGAFVAMIAVASVVNGASIAWNWYAAWPPFDEWAHLLNHVVLVAPSMIWLHRARFVTARAGSGPFVLAAAAYGLALALAWEVIESYIWVFPFWDTVSDIGLGVVGSALGGWWAGRAIRLAGSAPAP